MRKAHGIELLRMLAAALVLLAHLKFPVIDVCGADKLPAVLNGTWGAVGVDLFFVISGFVIALVVDRPSVTWKNFLAARLARVVPPYLLFTLAATLTTHIRYVPVTASSLVNSFLYLPVLDLDHFSGTFHPYGWSLCFEMWFYLLAAGLLAVTGRRAVIPVVVGVFVVGSLALAVSGYTPPWFFPRFALSPMAIEFALGCSAYWLSSRLPRWAGVLCLVAGIGALTIWVGANPEFAVMEPVLHGAGLAMLRAAVWGVPASLIVCGAVTLERRAGWFPAAGAADAAGAVSYSLYLVQPFAFLAVRGVFQWADWRSPWVVAVSAVVVTVGMAILVRRTVEVPLTTKAKDWLTRWLVRPVTNAAPSKNLSAVVGVTPPRSIP